MNIRKLVGMKKMALIVFVYAAFVQVLEAQFRFGVNATPHWSWMTSDDKRMERVGSQMGFRFGLVGDFFLDREWRYSITTGLNLSYNQGGTLQNGYVQGVFWPNADLTESRFDTVPMGAHLQHRVNFLDIPIGLKLRGGLGTHSPLDFFVELPVFNLGFRMDAKGDISNTVGQNTVGENIKSDIKGMAVSWGLGGGVEYQINDNTLIFCGMSFQTQLSDLTKNKNTAVLTTEGNWRRDNSASRIQMLSLRTGLFF